MTAENMLGRETSPYLRQHAGNPVHWQPWGAGALARAKAENKPILLSIGYAACHWCHVMAHESFENAAIARQINTGFVAIKLDREERPDLDAIYQTALAMLGEQGGWPLTMFCTPAGEPFWGGTYFPPSARFGRPGFGDVLDRIASLYAAEPSRIHQNVAALREALARLAAPAGGPAIDLTAIGEAASAIGSRIDPAHGGFTGAPKFPTAPAFRLLLHGAMVTGQAALRSAFTRTLDRMAEGGLYDHLGGGFARYCVDDRWLVPHFEKMLYDNAQLVSLYTLGWQETKAALYAARVAETIGWLLREMRNGGGFAASLDADSEGEEGRYYVWREAEIDAVLGAESPPFKAAYDVTAIGNWEGKVILNRLVREPAAPADTPALTAARARLLTAREARVRPGRDDKVLADWNGLAIAALAEAGVVFSEPAWVEAARRAFTFIMAELGQGDRLAHSWCAGQARHPGGLDDYANMAMAALALHEATGDAAFLKEAQRLVDTVESHFADAGGGYFATADDTRDVIIRMKTAYDGATPPGNATMVAALATLHALTGNATYADRALATLAAFAGEMRARPAAYASLFCAAHRLLAPVQIVLVGDGAAAAAMRDVVFAAALPTRVFQRFHADALMPRGHPAHGKTAPRGEPTAYLCEGPVCSPPLTSPDALAARLAASPHAVSSA